MVGLAEGWLSEICTLTQKSRAPAPFLVTVLLQGNFQMFQYCTQNSKAQFSVRYVTLYCKRDVGNHIESP